MKRSTLLDIFSAALRAGDPCRAVTEQLCLTGNRLWASDHWYDLIRFQRIVLAGAGKAAAAMARGAENVLGERIDRGIIVVPYGQAQSLWRVVLLEAAHPLPDEAGVRATESIRQLLTGAGPDELVLFLLSGGASSLLVAPAPGLSLEDKKQTTRLLLESGADIQELNMVRKHLSAVKGGRLAVAAYPAPVLTLILSDVPGDRADVIASGPTLPDRSSFADALAVIQKHSLQDRIPSPALSRLLLGVSGSIPDAPPADAPCFETARHAIVGSLRRCIEAARVRAGELGFQPMVVTSDLQGEAREAARRLAARVLEAHSKMKPGASAQCLLAGGETTVFVSGSGQGGRNQELALAFALQIEGRDGISFLSAGTDGRDGPTDAAGAFVDGTTARNARRRGLDPLAYLINNDSYTFFRKLDEVSGTRTQLLTGPTGTNVMDLQIALVETEAR